MSILTIFKSGGSSLFSGIKSIFPFIATGVSTTAKLANTSMELMIGGIGLLVMVISSFKKS